MQNSFGQNAIHSLSLFLYYFISTFAYFSHFIDNVKILSLFLVIVYQNKLIIKSEDLQKLTHRQIMSHRVI